MNIKFLRGKESALPASYIEGTIYFCTDTGNLFFDISTTERKQVNADYINNLINNLNNNYVSHNSNQSLNENNRIIARNNIGIYIQDEEPEDAVDGDIWITTAEMEVVSLFALDEVIGETGNNENVWINSEDIDNTSFEELDTVIGGVD